jgi:aminoglycoside phosphotransferase
VLCHASEPPALLAEWLRRGASIDVVTRCDLETWLAGGGGHPHLRCLWEVDPREAYDLALLWDPPDLCTIERWLRDLNTLGTPPDEIALWSRNPWAGARGPAWPRADALLGRAGWELGPRFLALPAADRVRQIVAWESYARTPLVQHRRSHRAWKEWIARQPAWRWRQPARLRRATRGAQARRHPVLDRILADVATQAVADVGLEQVRVSPNGVVIASVRLCGARGDQNAILKIPYTSAAEPRVARNAAGLAWAADRAGQFGSWANVAPRLLASRRVGGWSYTVEERVGGSEAQGWSEADAARLMASLGDLLSTLARLGSPARPLDEETLDRICAAPLRRAAALVDAPLAQRLLALGARLQTQLRGVPVPLVPRHGDFKLENVFGVPSAPEQARLLDWELWAPVGLPLLDAWHLVASRRARDAGCPLGTAVQRWLLSDELTDWERAIVARLARGLDPRYVALSPWLYWLDRIGPVAARGNWPTPAWEQANVIPVVDAAESLAAAV